MGLGVWKILGKEGILRYKHGSNALIGTHD